MARSAAITYEGLPLSSGGAHQLRTRGFAEGLDTLQSFVNGVSTQTIPQSLTVEVVIGREGRKFTDPLISHFTRTFGNITSSRGIGEFIGHQWNFEISSLPEVVERLESERPIPMAGYAGAAAVLHATWELTLIDPLTRQPLPYQGKANYLDFCVDFQTYLGTSHVYARISEKTSANLFLTLPFEEVNNDARDVAAGVQKYFPSRISSKHWKRWSLSKKGSSYVGRRIEGLLDSAVR